MPGLLKELPNPNGEAAMHKEVVMIFLGMLAKWI
jgi:hypothetical protein